MLERGKKLLTSLFRNTEELNRRHLLNLIEQREGGSLLDCGCGDGRFTMELARTSLVGEVHGIESMVERAREASSRGITVWNEDLNEPLSLPENRFDIVHGNQVLEHLVGTDTFFREIRRILRPGGIVLLSTNNLASWHSIVSLVFGFQPPAAHASDEIIVGNPMDPFRGHRFATPADSHQRVFTPRSLKELARHHGFRVQQLETVGWYPLPPSLARLVTRVDTRHGVFIVVKLQPPAPRL